MKMQTPFLVLMAIGCSPAPSGPPQTQAPPVTAPAQPNPQPSAAKKEVKRFDFKGDTPGVMTLEEFHAKYKSKPCDSEGQLVQMPRPGDGFLVVPQKLSDITVATIPVAKATYYFEEGVLALIRLETVDDKRGTVLAAMREKYGTPEKDEDLGAMAFLRWSNEGSTLSLGSRKEGSQSVAFADKALMRKRLIRTDPDAAREDAAQKDL